jgi:hypothetical protein
MRLDVRQKRQAQLMSQRPIEGGLVEEAAFDRCDVGRDPDSSGDPRCLLQHIERESLTGEKGDLAGQLRRLGWAGGNADSLTLNRQGG